MIIEPKCLKFMMSTYRKYLEISHGIGFKFT